MVSETGSPLVRHPGAGRGPGVDCRADAVFPALDPGLRRDDIEWKTQSTRWSTGAGAVM